MPALSNQNVLVATFATKVVTESLLSPQLRNICSKNFKLYDFLTISQLLEKVPVATFKELVATCGEWRQGWTTLFYAVEMRQVV